MESREVLEINHIISIHLLKLSFSDIVPSVSPCWFRQQLVRHPPKRRAQPFGIYPYIATIKQETNIHSVTKSYLISENQLYSITIQHQTSLHMRSQDIWTAPVYFQFWGYFSRWFWVNTIMPLTVFSVLTASSQTCMPLDSNTSTQPRYCKITRYIHYNISHSLHQCMQMTMLCISVPFNPKH